MRAHIDESVDAMRKLSLEELRRQMVDCKAKVAVCVEENLGNVLKAIEPLKGQIKV